MISIQCNLENVLFAFLSVLLVGCSIESENLIETIDEQKIITIYTKCEKVGSSSSLVKDHYLFKFKDKIITLTERHNNKVSNRQSSDSNIEKQLKNFIKISSNANEMVDNCKYYVKCGVKESRLYPTPEEVLYLDQVLISFTEGK